MKTIFPLLFLTIALTAMQNASVSARPLTEADTDTYVTGAVYKVRQSYSGCVLAYHSYDLQDECVRRAISAYTSSWQNANNDIEITQNDVLSLQTTLRLTLAEDEKQNPTLYEISETSKILHASRNGAIKGAMYSVLIALFGAFFARSRKFLVNLRNI